MCGAQLKVGETYVVSGRVIYGDKAHISSCGIAMPWRFVTSRQRKGFRHLYHSSCMCKVSEKNLGIIFLLKLKNFLNITMFDICKKKKGENPYFHDTDPFPFDSISKK